MPLSTFAKRHRTGCLPATQHNCPGELCHPARARSLCCLHSTQALQLYQAMTISGSYTSLPLSSLLLVFLTDNLHQASATEVQCPCQTGSLIPDPIYYAQATQWYRPDTQDQCQVRGCLNCLPMVCIRVTVGSQNLKESSSPQEACLLACQAQNRANGQLRGK